MISNYTSHFVTIHRRGEVISRLGHGLSWLASVFANLQAKTNKY